MATTAKARVSAIEFEYACMLVRRCLDDDGAHLLRAELSNALARRFKHLRSGLARYTVDMAVSWVRQERGLPDGDG